MASTLSPVRAGAKDAPAGTELVPEKKKGGKKKVLVILVVLLLVGGGAGYKLTKKPSGPSKPAKGAVLKLDSVSLNLAGGHYLKLGIALQQTKKAASDFDGSEATDIAISQFSGMSMDDLTVPAKREAAKKAYLDQVEKAYPKEVMDVYFTEFVMQ